MLRWAKNAVIWGYGCWIACSDALSSTLTVFCAYMKKIWKKFKKSIYSQEEINMWGLTKKAGWGGGGRTCLYPNYEWPTVRSRYRAPAMRMTNLIFFFFLDRINGKLKCILEGGTEEEQTMRVFLIRNKFTRIYFCKINVSYFVFLELFFFCNSISLKI